MTFFPDRTFRKYEKIRQNPHVALCADNIQTEGEFREGVRTGGRRAGSRPAAFRYVAGATYSYRKVPAGESASGFPAGIFRYDCAACRKIKKSVDNRWEK